MINYVAPVRVGTVDTGNVAGRGVMVVIWITSCTVSYVGIVVPFHETTLVGEDGVRILPVTDYDDLECVLIGVEDVDILKVRYDLSYLF